MMTKLFCSVTIISWSAICWQCQSKCLKVIIMSTFVSKMMSMSFWTVSVSSHRQRMIHFYVILRNCGTVGKMMILLVSEGIVVNRGLWEIMLTRNTTCLVAWVSPEGSNVPHAIHKHKDLHIPTQHRTQNPPVRALPISDCNIRAAIFLNFIMNTSVVMKNWIYFFIASICLYVDFSFTSGN